MDWLRSVALGISSLSGQELSKSFSEGKGMWKLPEGATMGMCLGESFGDFLPSFQATTSFHLFGVCKGSV